MATDLSTLKAGRKRRKQLLLGVCPIGKFVFSHEDALRQKKCHSREARPVEGRVLHHRRGSARRDGARPEVTSSRSSASSARRAIDALFVPHCNFGTEGAVGMIARELGVPVLLWGPRDEAPLADGSRLRDSLCGMFASSKVLGKLHVPFTYVENCRR